MDPIESQARLVYPEGAVIFFVTPEDHNVHVKQVLILERKPDHEALQMSFLHWHDGYP